MKSLAVLGVLLSVGALYADTPAGGSPAGAGSGSGSGAAPVKKPATELSIPEMSQRASGIHAQIEEDSRHVMYLKTVGQKKRDVIRVNCVNDRLVQIKAQMNIADATYEQLQASLANSSDDRKTLFTDLVTQGEGVKKTRDDADACIGEPELTSQERDVEVHHPDIIDDPTFGDPFKPDVEAPGYASPFN